MSEREAASLVGLNHRIVYDQTIRNGAKSSRAKEPASKM
jgi:hypothetical protein